MKIVKVAYVIPTLDMNEGGGILEFVYLLIKYLDRTRYRAEILVFYSRHEHTARFEDCGATVHVKSTSSEENTCLALFKWITDKLNELQPQIVHTNIFWADTVGREAAIRCGIPVIITTEHNTNLNETVSQRKVKKRLSLKTHLIICNTDSVRKYSVDVDQIDSEKLEVIPCAFNASRYANGITDILRLSGKCYFVGRLVDQKQPLELITAFADLIGERSDFSLTCIGDGSLRDQCQRLIDSLQMNRSIVLTGYREDPFEEVEDGSIFLLNSLFEGQGIVLLEAMSKGLVCIAPDCSGICDVINDGANGFLFKTGDPADLKRTIQKVASMDCSHLNQVRRNAYAEVIEKYHPEKMASKYMNVYHRLLGNEIH